MRSLLALVAVSLACFAWAQADEDPNYLYALSFQGGMTMTRHAKPEYAEGLRSGRPEGVSFNWRFESDDEAASRQEIDAINQVVAQVLKAEPQAVLALTSIRATRQGLWAFYTSDGTRLASALEEGLKGKTRTPVRLRVGKDAEWKAFYSFLARLREEK